MGIRSAKALRSGWRSLLALILLAPFFGVTPAPAQTVSDLEQDIQLVLDEIASAVIALSQGDASAASADLGEANVLLDELAALATDPGIKEEMGRRAKKVRRKMRGVSKRVRKAQRAVDSPRKRFSKQLKVLKSAYANGLKAASTVSPSVLAEENSKTAGFHNPGDLVTFRVYSADGTPCTEMPTVTVENQSFPNVVDISTVQATPDGTITMTMGEDQGGAYVNVTACGRSSTRLVYNYGPKLARGFPPNIPLGAYQISIRVTGDVDIPKTPVGTIENINLREFAEQLIETLEQAADSYKVPGCSTRIKYTRFDGQAFSIKFGVSCRIGGQSASMTMIFNIEKI